MTSLPSEVMTEVSLAKSNKRLQCMMDPPTVGVDVPKLVVQVEEAAEAVLGRGHWTIPGQHVLVELKVWRRFGKVQQSWYVQKRHGAFPSRHTPLEGGTQIGSASCRERV